MTDGEARLVLIFASQCLETAIKILARGGYTESAQRLDALRISGFKDRDTVSRIISDLDNGRVR